MNHSRLTGVILQGSEFYQTTREGPALSDKLIKNDRCMFAVHAEQTLMNQEHNWTKGGNILMISHGKWEPCEFCFARPSMWRVNLTRREGVITSLSHVLVPAVLKSTGEPLRNTLLQKCLRKMKRRTSQSRLTTDCFFSQMIDRPDYIFHKQNRGKNNLPVKEMSPWPALWSVFFPSLEAFLHQKKELNRSVTTVWHQGEIQWRNDPSSQRDWCKC